MGNSRKVAPVKNKKIGDKKGSKWVEMVIQPGSYGKPVSWSLCIGQ